MKTNRLLLLIMVVLMIACVPALGCTAKQSNTNTKSHDPAALVGTWQLTDESAESIKALAGEVSGTITLNDNGTGTVEAKAKGKTYVYSGNYTTEGDKITITSDDGSQTVEATYAIEGKQMVVEYSGFSVKFDKIK